MSQNKFSAAPSAPLRRADWFIVGLLLAVGGYLRLHDLSSRGFFEYDQAAFAVSFQKRFFLLQDPTWSFLARPVFFLIAAAASLLFGLSRSATLFGDGFLGAFTAAGLFHIGRCYWTPAT